MSLSRFNEQGRRGTLTPYTIELMQEHDLDEVVEIEEITGLNRWGYDAYRRELMKNANAVMLVAHNLGPGRRTIGFFAGWIVADEMHVNNIASHPDYRRIGIGEALLDRATEEAKRRGARYVLLEVRASNEVAQSLYRKTGFSYAGRRRDYYRSPTEDAFVMKLEVG